MPPVALCSSRNHDRLILRWYDYTGIAVYRREAVKWKGNAEAVLLHERVSRHQVFWQKREQGYPLVGFRLRDFFFSRTFDAAMPLLSRGQRITPELISTDEYMADYERMYQDNLRIGQEAFWTAEPFTGIPWIEGMLGCDIYSSEESFWAKSFASDPQALEPLKLESDNPWLMKFNEFTSQLTELSDGRFPLGQPVLRGPSDTLGAMLGQDNLVYCLYDYPEVMKKLALTVTNAFLHVISSFLATVPEFLGGYCMGFYPIWTPEKCVWFQEDLSALCSPSLYREFFLLCDEKICRAYPFSLVHLHPASLFILDDLLRIDDLKAIEINKDVGGPSVREMMSVFRRIMEKKSLVIWGDLDEEDIKTIRDNLPCRGIFLNIVAPSVSRAKKLNAYVRKVYGY
ncbi:hypothetical protein CEB3_c06110 [Peptococcaceae bacterium CEB3]|nr:hypothetical protein CEB3_c06110 [Peptococcaceae bacterium CEB3]